MTHEEMQEAIVDGIKSGIIYGIVRDGKLKFFHRDHIGHTITQAEADHAISAEKYLELSNADYHAREN